MRLPAAQGCCRRCLHVSSWQQTCSACRAADAAFRMRPALETAPAPCHSSMSWLCCTTGTCASLLAAGSQQRAARATAAPLPQRRVAQSPGSRDSLRAVALHFDGERDFVRLPPTLLSEGISGHGLALDVLFLAHPIEPARRGAPAGGGVLLGMQAGPKSTEHCCGRCPQCASGLCLRMAKAACLQSCPDFLEADARL